MKSTAKNILSKLLADTDAKAGTTLSAPNGKRSFKLLPIGIITAAFFSFSLLPSFYSTAGIWAAPLIVLLAAAACVLIFAPGLALLKLLGGRVPASLAPGMVIIGSAAGGWLLFWAWFTSPLIGLYSSLALSVAAMLVLSFKTTDGSWEKVSLPALVSIMVCIGYLSVAGDRGGLEYGENLIGGRYWAVMDNAIPRMFADSLMNNKARLKPFLLAHWHSSDRPPLQTGMIMAGYPFVNRAGAPLAYLVLAVAVNIFWVWGLWGFLRAVGLTERNILQVVMLR